MQNYIYGAGGHGKVVLDAMQISSIQCSGFIDDKEMYTWASLDVIQVSQLNLQEEIYLHLAIGNCKNRAEIASKLYHAKFFTVSHSSSVIAKTATIGIGSFLAAQCVIAPDVIIGRHCIINHSAVIDHDCVIGDFTHIAPNACLSGGVKIGSGVLVGAAAVILPGVSVANNVIIGAGAVVTKNIPDNVVVVGCPAKVI